MPPQLSGPRRPYAQRNAGCPHPVGCHPLGPTRYIGLNTQQKVVCSADCLQAWSWSLMEFLRDKT